MNLWIQLKLYLNKNVMKRDSNEFLVLMNHVYKIFIGLTSIGVIVTIYQLSEYNRYRDTPYGTILAVVIFGLIQILVLLNLITLNEKNLDNTKKILEENLDITDGLFEQFYDNGNIKTRGNYVRGKKDGLWESFYYDGSLNRSQTFKDGVWIS